MTTVSSSGRPEGWDLSRREIAIGLVVVVGLSFIAFVSTFADAQDENVGIFQAAREGDYFESKDDTQDWTIFWLCREIDALKAQMAIDAAAHRDDIREVRNILYGVLGAGGGGGGIYALWRKKRNGKNGGYK